MLIAEFEMKNNSYVKSIKSLLCDKGSLFIKDVFMLYLNNQFNVIKNETNIFKTNPSPLSSESSEL